MKDEYWNPLSVEQTAIDMDETRNIYSIDELYNEIETLNSKIDSLMKNSFTDEQYSFFVYRYSAIHLRLLIYYIGICTGAEAKVVNNAIKEDHNG